MTEAFQRENQAVSVRFRQGEPQVMGGWVREHFSDCAVHNEPAFPNGPCNCGGYVRKLEPDE